MAESNRSNAVAESPATQAKGLEGVIALETGICDIDGRKGELIYAGYDIQDLAEHASFEEVAFLLWNHRLPGDAERKDLERKLAAQRALSPMVLEILKMTPEDTSPMAALRTAVSVLAHFDSEADQNDAEAALAQAIRLTSRIPGIIAATPRLARRP